MSRGLFEDDERMEDGGGDWPSLTPLQRLSKMTEGGKHSDLALVR